MEGNCKTTLRNILMVMSGMIDRFYNSSLVWFPREEKAIDYNLWNIIYTNIHKVKVVNDTYKRELDGLYDV